MERPKLTIFLIIFLVFTFVGIIIGNQKWVQSSRVKPGEYNLEPPQIERNRPESDEDQGVDEAEEDSEEEEIPQTVAEREGIIEINKIMYATISLNVRADATTDSERVGSFSPGQEVIVTGQVNNGWYRVDYMGEEAYVYGIYLSDRR